MASQSPKLERNKLSLRKMRNSWQLYLIFFLPLVYFVVFRYVPMYGIIIAFQDFRPVRGIAGSDWVGFANFIRFFNSHNFWNIIWNTFILSVYTLAVNFPVPIVLALMLHNCVFKRFKRTVQTVTYAPHFISTVVMVGMIIQFLHPNFGFVNNVIRALGFEPIPFMAQSATFRSVFVFSDLWQHAGWGTIIYLAALSAVDPTLHEAAAIDGASKLKRILHIDLPSILPVTVIMLILSMGDVLDVGFEKVFLMQNPLNLSVSEVISTHVYSIGIAARMPDFSYATAIGLFNSIISFTLIVAANAISKRVSETSLW